METALIARDPQWNVALARLRWFARVKWQALEGPELLAIATIGFALGLSLWVNRPLHREVRDLQAGVAAARNVQAAAAARPGQDRPSGTEGLVAGFMAFLPTAEMREQQLHTLHGLAAQSGIDLARVEYGHGELEHLPGRRMTMQLTLRAEYGAYRTFLHDLLLAMPNLGIDRVTMERVPAQPAQVAGAFNVRLETSLYYRSPAATATP